jgi:hypothetical protein
MSHAITFDTLEFQTELKKAGFNEIQAEALTRANAQAFSQMMDTSNLATKFDLLEMRAFLQGFIIKVISAAIFLISGTETLLHYLR